MAEELGVELNTIHIPSDFIARYDSEMGSNLLGDKSHSVIFDNTKITPKNKEVIQEFLQVYDVKPATKVLFLEGIGRFLEKTQDITKDMHDRKKINRIFYELVYECK